MENFECPICGYEGKPRRKDTYHYCPDCTVVFLTPFAFSASDAEKYGNDNSDIIIDEIDYTDKVDEFKLP
jgi:rubredoxin